jgi:hypothetical protein
MAGPVDRHDLAAMSRDMPVQGAPTPYIQRKIDVTIKLGEGNFGDEGFNTVTLRGLRVQSTISRVQLAQPQCETRIYGMSFDMMKMLSNWGRKYDAQRNNILQIEAGDDLAGMTQVFAGTITDAFFDGESQPDVAFQIQAFEGDHLRLKPAPPVSVAGTVDVATVMSSLAKQMGVEFEDHGVTAKLRDIYYPGTALNQVRRMATDAGINYTLENNVLAIWPRGVARDTGTIPLISPKSGMRSYPKFNEKGIIVTSLFRDILLGQKIAVQSSLWAKPRKNLVKQTTPEPQPVYTNYYTVYALEHTLQSEMPNGPWFSTFMASTTSY